MENTKSKNYQEYRNKLNQCLINGSINGSVATYDQKLIDNLRSYSYAGIPASIVILSPAFCNSKCFEMSLLLSRGLEIDYKLVKANINALMLNPKNNPLTDDSYHYFIETISSFEDSFVYDTSSGIVYKKELFYEIENPDILKTYTKDEVNTLCEKIKFTKNNNSVAALSNLFLEIEELAKNKKTIYYDMLQTEIDNFKNSNTYTDYLKQYKNR